MSRDLNFSTRPFLNPRPVLRLTILLWVAGMAVAAFNARLYFSHFTGSSEIREREAALKASLEQERNQVARLDSELEEYDLAWAAARQRA